MTTLARCREFFTHLPCMLVYLKRFSRYPAYPHYHLARMPYDPPCHLDKLPPYCPYCLLTPTHRQNEHLRGYTQIIRQYPYPKPYPIAPKSTTGHILQIKPYLHLFVVILRIAPLIMPQDHFLATLFIFTHIGRYPMLTILLAALKQVPLRRLPSLHNHPKRMITRIHRMDTLVPMQTLSPANNKIATRPFRLSSSRSVVIRDPAVPFSR